MGLGLVLELAVHADEGGGIGARLIRVGVR